MKMARPREPFSHKVARDTGRAADALIIVNRHAHRRRPSERAWMIDQIVRALTGDSYDAWVCEFRATHGKWDEGTQPL